MHVLTRLSHSPISIGILCLIFIPKIRYLKDLERSGDGARRRPTFVVTMGRSPEAQPSLSLTNFADEYHDEETDGTDGNHTPESPEFGQSSSLQRANTTTTLMDSNGIDNDDEDDGEEGLRIISHPQKEEIYRHEIVRLREELKAVSSRKITRRLSLRRGSDTT